MPILTTLQKLKDKDGEFKVNLGIMSFCFRACIHKLFESNVYSS